MAHLRSNSLTAGRQHPRLAALSIEEGAGAGAAPPSRSARARSLLRASWQSGSSGGGGRSSGSTGSSCGSDKEAAAGLDGGAKEHAAPAALEAAYRKAQARVLPIFMLM